jgi:Na+/H+ antiporter NhaA
VVTEEDAMARSATSALRRRDDAGEQQTRTRRRELIAQLSAPLRSFLVTESGSAGLLLGATLLALAWANSPWSSAYEDLWGTELAVHLGGATFGMDLRHWVNDAVMALFFFVIGLEVRRELSVGELRDRRRAVVPLVAGLAGMVVPALLFLALNPSGPGRAGWGVVIGTDTAFLLGALALLGPRFSTQLRIFLLTLSVIDDIVAVTVIGLFYSDQIRPLPVVVAAACLVAIWQMSRRQVWRSSPFVVVGLLLWVTTVEGGLHAAIAGMLAGLLVEARPPEPVAVEGAATGFTAFRQSPLPAVGRAARRRLDRAISVNERLQETLHPWTSFVVVPLFAFANAGVDLRGGLLGDALTSPVTWGACVALVLGKPLGIAAATALGIRGGLGRLPVGVAPGHVLGGAVLSGIGFTVSLLIADLAFDDPRLRDEATVGVLLALVVATVAGWFTFRAVARFRHETDADLPRFLDRPVDVAHDHIRGPVDAPLTLVEYGDFECPFCARATGVTRELRERFGDRLRYVFRHLPLCDVHPRAEIAAYAAVAADRQGRFWEMHDLLFAHQQRLAVEDLIGYAGKLDLDVDVFLDDLRSPVVQARVRADVASAEASGARGTPTFFVGDRRHIGAYDAETLAAELGAISSHEEAV